MSTAVELNRTPEIEGNGKQSTVVRTYRVYGTMNATEASSLALIETPGAQMVDGFLLTKITYATRLADYGVWEVEIKYEAPDKDQEKEPPLQEGDSTYEFDTTGGTTHITQSLETVDSKFYSNAYNKEIFHGAIGVNQDRTEVAGCDIVIPVYAFGETHALPDNMVTGAYKAKLFFLTGKTNNATFRDFEPSEVLFLGARGTKRRSDNTWEVHFGFAASENIEDVTIGGITGINKKGWEYLWFHYNKRENDGELILQATSAHIEKVYREGSFSQLGIGE